MEKKYQVIKGVKYESAPESRDGVCVGCAFHNSDNDCLCYSNGCGAHDFIWVRSEDHPKNNRSENIYGIQVGTVIKRGSGVKEKVESCSDRGITLEVSGNWRMYDVNDLIAGGDWKIEKPKYKFPLVAKLIAGDTVVLFTSEVEGTYLNHNDRSYIGTTHDSFLPCFIDEWEIQDEVTITFKNERE